MKNSHSDWYQENNIDLNTIFSFTLNSDRLGLLNIKPMKKQSFTMYAYLAIIPLGYVGLKFLCKISGWFNGTNVLTVGESFLD